MKLARRARRLRFRSEESYDAFLDASIPCASCAAYDLPRAMQGCECGDYHCDDCHEQRACCGDDERRAA